MNEINQTPDQIAQLFADLTANEKSTVKATNKTTGEAVIGEVTHHDNETKMIMITTPEGEEKIINVLDYIVTIIEAVKFVIPILTPIVRFFKKLFRRKKNR